MAITLCELMQAIRDNFTSDTITDAVLTRRIAAAVRFYSRYNPLVVRVNLTTVANQQNYALPANTLSVMDVDWWSTAIESTGGLGLGAGAEPWPYDDDYLWEGVSYDQWSLRAIAEIKRSERARRTRGAWWVMNTDLMLDPIPAEAGKIVRVLYAGLHAINVGGTSYTSIPLYDLEILRDLAMAEVISAKGADLAGEPDYSEGLFSISHRFARQSVAEWIGALRQSCIAKYRQEFAFT